MQTSKDHFETDSDTKKCYFILSNSDVYINIYINAYVCICVACMYVYKCLQVGGRSVQLPLFRRVPFDSCMAV